MSSCLLRATGARLVTGPADVASVAAAMLAAAAAVLVMVMVRSEGVVPFFPVVPAVLIAPVRARRSRAARALHLFAGFATLTFAFLAILSIGVFFAPAAIMGLVAAALPERWSGEP